MFNSFCQATPDQKFFQNLRQIQSMVRTILTRKKELDDCSVIQSQFCLLFQNQGPKV